MATMTQPAAASPALSTARSTALSASPVPATLAPVSEASQIAAALALIEGIKTLRARGFRRREDTLDPMTGNTVTVWARTWKGVRDVVAVPTRDQRFAIAYQVWAEDSPDDALIADPDLAIWRTGGEFLFCVEAILAQPSPTSHFPTRPGRDHVGPAAQ